MLSIQIKLMEIAQSLAEMNLKTQKTHRLVIFSYTKLD